MSAVGVVLKEELRNATREPFYRGASLAVVLVALVVMALSPVRHAPTALEADEEDRGVTSIEVSDPPLVPFARGLAEHMGRSFAIHSHSGVVEATPREYVTGAVWSGFRSDLVTCARFLFALLALTCGVLAVVPDKEHGVLRHVLAHPVRRGEWVLGKAGAWIILACLPVALSLAGGVVVLLAAGRLPLDAEVLGRLTGIGVVLLLHQAVFVFLGLAIGLLVRRTEDGLAFALVVWLVLAIVVPVAATPVARLLVPVGSAEAVQDLQWQSWGVRMVLRNNWRIPEELRAEGNAEYSLDVVRSAEEAFLRDTDRQKHALLSIMAASSPSGALLGAAAALAGTGVADWVALREALRDQAYLTMRGQEGVFRAPRRSFAEAIRSAAGGMGGLLAWLTLAAGAVIGTARRLSV